MSSTGRPERRRLDTRAISFALADAAGLFLAWRAADALLLVFTLGWTLRRVGRSEAAPTSGSAHRHGPLAVGASATPAA